MNIIIYTSSTNKSGGTRQALYLAQGMHERGHNVTFFHPSDSEIRTIAPDFPCFVDLGEKRDWRKNIEAAFPQDQSGCIVHAFHNAAVKKLAWWSLFWKKQAVAVAHRGVIFRPNNPLPYWSPGIACFLVNSHKCLSVLHGMGVGLNRLAVIPNAVPDDRIRPHRPAEVVRAELGWTDNHFIFGTVANDSPVKGIKTLLQAFAPVVQEFPDKARLLAIGVSPGKWMPLCRELHIPESSIRVVDQTEDVASYLASLNVFILPSLSESMPNTLLEALRTGLPCIGSDVGAVKEIMGNSGILVPPGKPKDLAAAMTQLINQPDQTLFYADNAQIQAKNYVPAVRLTHITHIYRTLLSQRGFNAS